MGKIEKTAGSGKIQTPVNSLLLVADLFQIIVVAQRLVWYPQLRPGMWS